MRKLLGLLVLVLLCGCTGPASQTPPATSSPTVPTVPELPATEKLVLGLHIEGLSAMGDVLLAFEEDKLTVLQGEHLTPGPVAYIPNLPMPDSGMIQIKDTGVAYFDRETQSVVYLDVALRENGRVELKEAIIGPAYLTPDWSRLFYCKTDGLWEWNLSTGLTRLIRAQEGFIGVVGGLLNGEVLQCTHENGKTVCILAENGKMTDILQEDDILIGSGGFYVLRREAEYIFGFGYEQSQSFTPAGKGEVYFLPEMGGAVQLTDGRMEFYDLKTGKRLASTGQIPDAKVLTAGENVLWLYIDGSLFRWTLSRSLTEDDYTYTAPRYSLADPDDEGLAALKTQAQDLGVQYGVDILFYTDVIGLEPWDYSFSAAFDVESLKNALSELEQALAAFPTDFFTKATAWTGSTVKLLLVDGIYGGPVHADFESAPGVYYVEDDVVYIALTVQEDLKQNFYHQVGHLMETPILTFSTAYYEWHTLNPGSFQYDNDYEKNQNRTDEQYLQEGKRYFVSMYSMSFAMEDRCTIFEAACMPGNEELFQSKFIQAKLRRICNGMRTVFELPEGEYLWEQYLQ